MNCHSRNKKLFCRFWLWGGDPYLKNRNHNSFTNRKPRLCWYQGLSSQKFLSFHDDRVTWYDVAVRIQAIKKFSSQNQIENLGSNHLELTKKSHSRFPLIDSISRRIWKKNSVFVIPTTRLLLWIDRSFLPLRPVSVTDFSWF